MAITFTNQGSSAAPDLNVRNSVLNSFSTSSWTPPNELIIVYVFNNVTSGSAAAPTSITGNGITWTKIQEVLTAGRALSLWAANGSGATAGATTIDYGGVSQQSCVASFFSAAGTDVANGVAQTFVQSPVTTSASRTSISTTLSAAANSNNRPIYGAEHNQNAAKTPRTNWTEVDDLAGATPNRGLETQYRSDAFETTASATWDGTSVSCTAIAAEIKAGSTSQTVTAGLIDQTAATFSPQINQQVVIGLINQAGSVFGPSIVQAVGLGLINQAGSVYSPVFTLGGVNVSPALINQAGATFSPSLAQRAVIGLLDYTAVIYSPTFTLGNVNVTPGLLNYAGATFTPSFLQQVLIGLIDRTGSVYSPTFTLGTVSITPGLINNAGSVFSPSLSQPFQIPLIDRTGQVFTPAFTLGAVSITPGLISNVGSVFAPTFSLGNVNVTVGLINRTGSVFTPLVRQPLTPELLSYLGTVFDIIGIRTTMPEMRIFTDVEVSDLAEADDIILMVSIGDKTKTQDATADVTSTMFAIGDHEPLE